MKNNRIFLGIFFAAFLIHAADDYSLYEKVLLLRDQQQVATVKEAAMFEKSIISLKNEEGNYTLVHRFPEWYYIFNCLPLIVWQLLFLSSWFMGLFILVINRRKRLIFILCVFFWVISGTSVGIHYVYKSSCWGIITQKTALYGSPSADSFVRTYLDHLDEVVILQKEPGWVKIKGHGKIGWVNEEKVYRRVKASL